MLLAFAVIGGLFTFCLIAGFTLAAIDIKVNGLKPIKYEEKIDTIRLAPERLGTSW